MEASQIGVWEHNLGEDRILWDQQMHRLYCTGRSERMVPAEMWTNAIHPDDRREAEDEFERAIAAKGLYNSQFRIVWPNGEIRYMRSRAHFYEGPGGVPSFIGAEWDVTADVMLNRELAEQKTVAEARAIALEKSKARIEHAADHDYLTGLPNRRYFDRRLVRLREEDGDRTAAIIHIDLDRFKQINDKSGHAAGDAMLRNAAACISGAISKADMVARIGGDEFVVLLLNFGDVDALKKIADTILERLRNDIHSGQEALQGGASIGVAWGKAADAGNLLAESDLALFQAKRLGRNRVEFFTLKLQSDLQGERQLAEELRLALQRKEIVPYYQVQVDARTRRIFGLEALARWVHPQRGLLLPGIFMKVADEYGLTADLDAAILNQVLRDRKDWEKHGVVPPRVAVNISGSRLNDPGLIASLAKLDIPPHAIVFELVETIFLDDTDESVLLDIDRIKKMGIDIEIDDFGSGHASLIGLVKLKPKRLKIDRQLVTAITVSDEQRRLVGSIVEIAKALNVEVIAEGVETEDHARLLARIGCDGLQGYAIGYPSSAAQTLALLISAGAPDVRGSGELQSARS
jgi:diguanylate cyclase